MKTAEFLVGELASPFIIIETCFPLGDVQFQCVLDPVYIVLLVVLLGDVNAGH